MGRRGHTRRGVVEWQPVTESDHYGSLWKGANAEGWHLFRIADGSVGKKPADITGCTPDGVGVLLEVKSFVRRASWATDSPHWPAYAIHQKAWLRHYAEACAMPLVAEYDESRREMRVYLITSAGQVEGPAYTGVVHSVVLPKASGVYAGWWALLDAWKMYRWAKNTVDRPQGRP